ncbi:hypothetical protein OH76DRAFT_77051 [Lentinus brumalis]|uniref:Uncharacterized protein n=1 Tax=Lentinus brumalis TaxID=2498619 RepID=A0A371DKU0_9APHY|nr:hypothetical protein OH76DRAFT_77051 [Polyporus brumalis]
MDVRDPHSPFPRRPYLPFCSSAVAFILRFCARHRVSHSLTCSAAFYVVHSSVLAIAVFLARLAASYYSPLARTLPPLCNILFSPFSLAIPHVYTCTLSTPSAQPHNAYTPPLHFLVGAPGGTWLENGTKRLPGAWQPIASLYCRALVASPRSGGKSASSSQSSCARGSKLCTVGVCGWRQRVTVY